MHRQDLLKFLENHKTRFMEELAFLARARTFVMEHENCFDRSLLTIHVTGSVWVVNPTRDKVLLMHHKKLNQWFQPGGHADGDADILRVALKETAEETGLEPEHIRLVDHGLFDVDIHTIHHSIHDPRHQHIDCRFLVEIDDRLPIPGNPESHQIIWVPLWQAASYNKNKSTNRMIQKTRTLLNNL